MSELYRFDIDYPMHPEDEEGMKHIPCDDGEYVLAGAALALQAKVEELRASRDWPQLIDTLAAQEATITELQAKVEELRARRISDLDWALELQQRKQDGE